MTAPAIMTDEQRAAQWMGCRWANFPGGGQILIHPGVDWKPWTEHYATDANAWPPVWADLERRGLRTKYTDALHFVLVGPKAWAQDWFLITATPEQRLAALCRVIEGEKTDD